MTQHYVGTKIVKAWPQDRAKLVNAHPIGAVPSDAALQSETVAGYAVMYEDGYTSWCPKEQFEAANVPLGHLDGDPPHLRRMKAELATLRDRIDKLDRFVGQPRAEHLTAEDYALMGQQRRHMHEYAATLAVRVNLEEGKVRA